MIMSKSQGARILRSITYTVHTHIMMTYTHGTGGAIQAKLITNSADDHMVFAF